MPPSTQEPVSLINLRSVRWSEHFLDASTGKKNKGNVYVTKGEPDEAWAIWKLIHRDDGYVNIESTRWPKHFLDASTGKEGKGDVFVTKGNPDKKWAQWKLHHRGDGEVNLESVRWPGHFLDASTGKPGRGNVYVTKGNCNEPWARWTIDIRHVAREEETRINLNLVPVFINQAMGQQGSYEKTQKIKSGYSTQTYSPQEVIDISVKALGKINTINYSNKANVNTMVKSAFQSAAWAINKEQEAEEKINISLENPCYVYQALMIVTAANKWVLLKGSCLVITGEPVVKTSFQVKLD